MASPRLPGRAAWAEVDLGAIAANIRTLREPLAGTTRLCAVVKADAYGHGAVRVARAALAAGADCLAVAMGSEAVELREAGIEVPVLVMGRTPPELASEAARYGFSAAVSSLDEGRALAEAGRAAGTRVGIQIKIDSGMSRLGFEAEAAAPAAAALAAMPGLRIEGAFSHLATADSDPGYAREQLARFLAACAGIEALGVPLPLRHIANSAAARLMPEARLDMVRTGIALYGYGPQAAPGLPPLRPALRLVARLSLVREVPAGVPVGYGRAFTTARPSRIGILPLGYADGLRRELSGRAMVGTPAGRAPLVGRICMDQCMADLTELPGVAEGDEVELIGGRGPDAEELAALAGTISYELLSCLGRRLPRVYLEEGAA